MTAKTIGTGFLKFTLFIALIQLSAITVFAQNILPRISVAERSDKLGYVIRYHFEIPPDSFKIFQPSSDLIQLAVYKSGVNITNVALPPVSETFQRLDLHSFPDGFGTDIRLGPNRYYLARAYPDANRRHLLIGLTQISQRESALLTDAQQKIDWTTVNSRTRSSVTTEQPVELTELQPIENPGGLTIGQSDTLELEGTADPSIIDRLPDSLSTPIPSFQNRINTETRLRTIVIDAGHGGNDPGAIGASRQNREKDIALAVSKKVGAYINEHLPDVNVVYTRSDDRFIKLEERGSIANRARGDLFISIHTNSARSSQAYGAEVYFLGMARTESALEVMKRENSVIFLEDADSRSRDLTDEELILYELNNIGYMSASQRLAELVDRQFTDRARRRSRGVKQAGFIVLYHASMPAILIELGFISNPAEERFLASESGQNILASAIFRAIREYKELIEH